MTAWIKDCMTRVFPGQSPPENPAREMRITAAGNEYACFQVGIGGIPEGLGELGISVSDLLSGSGEVIPGRAAEVLYAEYVPVHWHTPPHGRTNRPGDTEGAAPGFYPDPLLPAALRSFTGHAMPPDPVSAWIRIRVDASTPAGIYRGLVVISWREERREISFDLEVLPFSLPAKSRLFMTNWLSVSNLLSFSRVEPFSAEFWELIGIYARNLSGHRQNVILTPLLAGPGGCQLVDIEEKAESRYRFDFRHFDRWADIFLGHGLEMIEGSPLAAGGAGGCRKPVGITMSGPSRGGPARRDFASTGEREYLDFLGHYLAALRAHLDRRKLLGKFCLHISDEPGEDDLVAYGALAGFIRKAAPGIKLIDAIGLPPEFSALIDYPVIPENGYGEIVEKSGVPKDRFWFYYCCGPGSPWPNRFLDCSLIRVRIFTWLAFRYRLMGFLHWGLNYWAWFPKTHPGGVRREETYNPYDNVTGGSLPPGDGYVIYPPRRPSVSREPVDSIRWEIIRKAMEDYEYLAMLEQMVSGGEGRPRDLEEGRALLRELEERVVPDFTGYTRDACYLEDFRGRVARSIVRLAGSS